MKATPSHQYLWREDTFTVNDEKLQQEINTAQSFTEDRQMPGEPCKKESLAGSTTTFWDNQSRLARYASNFSSMFSNVVFIRWTLISGFQISLSPFLLEELLLTNTLGILSTSVPQAGRWVYKTYPCVLRAEMRWGGQFFNAIARNAMENNLHDTPSFSKSGSESNALYVC